MSHAFAHSTLDRELSLSEMLADPIVCAVMVRDGVTRQDVEGLIEAVRAGRAARQMAEHEMVITSPGSSLSKDDHGSGY